ncbi:melatonin-related receptor isoform X3 [Corapipo altera]|uniref:melatonin-related receptor isoform X3 n=1 Tax=Corapipo altera TaxID=415028 RepID=UPI000FD67DE6|nr:melatonin-related receptor isoform X3 [Corapipo altera]
MPKCLVKEDRGGGGGGGGEFLLQTASCTALALLLCIYRAGARQGAALSAHSFPMGNDANKQGNIFVVSLSVADLVVAVYPYPLILSAIFHNGWTMGNVHCQISGFLMGLSVIGSIFNITAIAINRYCYICHSLRYDKLFNLKNTCCYLCLTWILTVVAIVPNFFVGSLQYDPRIYSCTFAQTALDFTYCFHSKACNAW